MVQVYVCAPEVLLLFSDNFDYQVATYACSVLPHLYAHSQKNCCMCVRLMYLRFVLGLQNVRREFVTGVLSEEELGNKIFIHELLHGYAARVSNLRAYDAVRALCFTSRHIAHC